MMSARCLCMGSSVVVRDGGGGLDDRGNMEEDDVIRGRGSDVLVGEGAAMVVVGKMASLSNDDDCAPPHPS